MLMHNLFKKLEKEIMAPLNATEKVLIQAMIKCITVDEVRLIYRELLIALVIKTYLTNCLQLNFMNNIHQINFHTGTNLHKKLRDVMIFRAITST